MMDGLGVEGEEALVILKVGVLWSMQRRTRARSRGINQSFVAIHLYHEPRYRVQPCLQAQRSWWTIGKPKCSAHVTLSFKKVGPTHTGRFAERRARADLRG
jgi:hypothetical protein